MNLRKLSIYHWGVLLSTLSAGLGLLREAQMIYLFGFTAINDELQLYLSVFYTISLSADAVRLASLNLATYASFSRILWINGGVIFVSSVMLASLYYFLSDALSLLPLCIATAGGILNVLMLVIITHKQRYGKFLSTQIINVLPNVVLIPGIVCISYLHSQDLLMGWVLLFFSLPVLQLFLLFLIKIPADTSPKIPSTLYHDLSVFFKHGMSIPGEQLFQVVIRTAFLSFGAGYLSLWALCARIYATLRVILIDTYIGSRLKLWESNLSAKLDNLIENNGIALGLILLTVLLSQYASTHFGIFAAQLVLMLLVSFYFSSLLRIAYFKINRFGHHSSLILRFAFIEMGFALLVGLLSLFFSQQLLFLLWLWYVLRVWVQLWKIRPNYIALQHG